MSYVSATSEPGAARREVTVLVKPFYLQKQVNAQMQRVRSDEWMYVGAGTAST
jgi:hypothetical protein